METENKMNLIPKPKKITYGFSEVDASKINWRYDDNIDERIKNAANRIRKSDENGIKVYVKAGKENCESYNLKITDNCIEIVSNGIQGVFYGLQTLDQMLKSGHGKLKTCEVFDEPDLAVRGFYYDISRGRVPNVEHLKKVIDQLANFKINMLQLYVENAFEFKEYVGITRPENMLTAKEIREIDTYCRERFIEFIPSLSTFGHLYDLLQSDRYKNLCEYENYEPKGLYWTEKMDHHTIDVSNPDSEKVIFSLIDQYAPLFKSNTFNICCDETFDLCKGKNKGLDEGEEYFKFVSKIIGHLRNKGKRVQMWADVALNYPQKIELIRNDIELLNWEYGEEPSEEKIKKISDKNVPQILCPGVSSWVGFIMDFNTAEKNISKMSMYAQKYNCLGMLNTAWGDFGGVSPWNGYVYGVVLGAEKAWNVSETVPDSGFEDAVSSLVFGIQDWNVIPHMKRVSEVASNIWLNLVRTYSAIKAGNESKSLPEKALLYNIIDVCKDEILFMKKYCNDSSIEDIIAAIWGTKLAAEAFLRLGGEKNCCYFDELNEWFCLYERVWEKESKPSELFRIKDFLEGF